MNKNIIIIILAVSLFGAGGASGYMFAKRASDKGVIKQQKKDAKEVMKHEEAKDATRQKIKTIVRTRIRTVVDPSGCLGTSSPDVYLDGLLDADRAAQSGFN